MPIPAEASYLLSFPAVPPEDRPKNLYVREWVGEDIVNQLEARGWRVIDIRLMPNRTDGDRAEAVKACLEGARVGSLQLSAADRSALELEARVAGLLTNKPAPTDTSINQIDGATLDQLLSFGRAPDAPPDKIAPPKIANSTGVAPKKTGPKPGKLGPKRMARAVEYLKAAHRYAEADALVASKGDISVLKGEYK